MKDWVGRVEKENRKRARRKHEDCEFGSLKDIKRPIPLQGAKERRIRDAHI